jgi:hypothetical protein
MTTFNAAPCSGCRPAIRLQGDLYWQSDADKQRAAAANNSHNPSIQAGFNSAARPLEVAWCLPTSGSKSWARGVPAIATASGAAPVPLKAAMELSTRAA